MGHVRHGAREREENNLYNTQTTEDESSTNKEHNTRVVCFNMSNIVILQITGNGLCDLGGSWTKEQHSVQVLGRIGGTVRMVKKIWWFSVFAWFKVTVLRKIEEFL